MRIKIGNAIGEYLKDLEVTVDQLADTWRPDDPQTGRTCTAKP
jgi:hypothetical protein